jgi:F0F1-type ATP synthase membrane subunit b/b'
MHTILEWVLIVSVFLIGVLVTIAVDHAIEHFRANKAGPKKSSPAVPAGVTIPAAMREQLIEKAGVNFQKVLDNSATVLQRDLGTVTEKLNRQLEKLGSDIVNSESERYRKTIEGLRKQAEANITEAQTETTNHQADIKTRLSEKQAELEADLAAKIASEKELIIKQIDTKLSDAVMSFLTEALEHNVDLGAQGDYLVGLLEEHKDEIKKGIADET